MKVVSLFAGIGGFDLGFQRTGFEIVGHVEIDKNCRKLLADKWPGAVAHDDVRTAGKRNLPACDVVAFGFPCQDLSVAGKRAGLSGERSGLFYEAMRIIDEIRPAWCLWENVPGLLSSDEGRDLARVLVRLGESGYFGCVRVLDAQWIGVAQRRRRCFGLFTRLDSGAERCAEILSLSESLRGHPAPSREAGKGFTSGVAPCAGVSGTLDRKSCSANRGRQANETEFIIPAVARTVSCNGARGGIPSNDGLDGCLIPAVAGCLAAGAHPGSYNGQDAHNDILVPVAFDMAHGDDPARVTGDKTNTLQSRMGTGGNQVPYVAQVQWASGGGQLENPTAQALRSGAEHNYQFVRVGMAVRRLTPTECEKLQGFTTNTKRCMLSVCLDHQRSVAHVAVKCRKWPDNVWPVGAGEKTELVNIAGSLFRNDQESQGALVAVHVRMQSEPRVAAILNQGRLCWSVNGAAGKNSFPLSMLPDDFAQETATLIQFLEREADSGKVESQQSMTLSIRQSGGGDVAPMCGQEKEQSANDAKSICRRGTFITFSIEQDTREHDLTKATLFCSVINAIASSIPSETLGESFCLTLDLESDYTAGFADSTRYRMLGNAVCVNVAEWIAKRLMEEIA